MAGRASSPSSASLDKAEGGASVSHGPLGLSGVLPGKKVADTIPFAQNGSPSLCPTPVPWDGRTLGAGLVCSAASGQNQQGLVRTWSEGCSRGGLSFSESFEDFFVSLESKASISPLFYSTTKLTPKLLD